MSKILKETTSETMLLVIEYLAGRSRVNTTYEKILGDSLEDCIDKAKQWLLERKLKISKVVYMYIRPMIKTTFHFAEGQLSQLTNDREKVGSIDFSLNEIQSLLEI